MATETTRQVIPSSADLPGMSVVTASRNQDAPRAGLIYNPTTLAAAEPVWFHPMPDGRYLGVFSRRLTNAQLSSETINGSLLYTGYTLDTTPCWALIGPRTGDLHKVDLIPSEQPGIRTLVGAASRGNYLFILNSYKKTQNDDTTYSLLQNFRVSPNGTITLLGEELVPGSLRLGIYCDVRYLWLFGADSDGMLIMARKNWGRIGTDADANPIMNWQFWGGGSWNTDSGLMLPMSDDKGVKLAVAGPCSVARYRDTYYLMATTTTDYPITGPSGTARLTPLMSPDGSKLYVADFTGNTVQVIDTTTNTVSQKITTKGGPYSMGFTPDGTALYVASQTANLISVVDPTTNKITAQVDIRKPGQFVFHPNGTRLYVVSLTGNQVTVIDTSTNQLVTTITVGEDPFGIATNATGTRLYVTNQTSHTVSIINTETNKVIKTASVGAVNKPTLITRKDSSLYIGGTDMLPVLSATYNRVLNTIPVRNVGQSLIAHPTSNLLYLANTLDSVSVIDLDTSSVTNTIATGTEMGAVQIALSPNGTRLYATNTHDSTVSVIDTTTNAVIAVITLSQAEDVTINTVLKSVFSQLSAVLYGVVNGFIKNGTGVVAIVADLLGQATKVITGSDGTIDLTVTGLVDDFLQALIGVAEVITDPAAVLNDILAAITGHIQPPDLLGTAQSFLQGTISTILGLGTDVITLNPTKLLEDLIRAITGILTGTGNTGGGAADSVTVGTSQVSLTPEPSWQASVFSTRKVQQTWTRHPYTYPIAKTTTLYQQGGGYLQEQIPLTPGYGVIPAVAEVTTLNEFSDHTQVVTGTSPHTVILPSTGQPVGTTVSTEGVLLVPDTATSFTPALSISDAAITEGALRPSTVTFRVSLSSSTSDTVTVKYATANSTATAGQDYTAASGTLTFPPGIVSQQVSVTISGDLHYEPDETFTVTLSNPVNANIDDDTALCTIVNDDRETFIESLLEQFRSIVNGLTSGAITLGSTLVTAVSTILEQSVRTLTGVIGDTGTLVTSLVDQFLGFVSGNSLDLGNFASPAELLGSILSRITGGTGEISSQITSFANQFMTAIVSNPIVGGVVDIFQNLVGSLFGGFGLSAPMALMSAPTLMSASTETTTDPVVYMPYTIHNQSTADIVVMASGRDKPITVKHGTGVTFTPYVPEPTLTKDWSWTYSTERAPRARQGFPFLATTRLNINTYQLSITGSPSSGRFRLAHDGHISEPVSLGTSTADSIRRALASLSSVSTYTVTQVSSTLFSIVIVEDCSTLSLYSYRLLNGTSPKVEVSLDNSDSTLLTRWSIFQPIVKPAKPSGLAKDAATPRRPSTTETPTGLAEIIAQFTKVVTVVSEGTVAVGAGVVLTVADLINQALYLTTGEKVTDTTTAHQQVTDFLQKLAADTGVSQDAGAAFESVLRQITGGTGLTGVGTIPTPLDFVTAAVNAVEDSTETLAETLQKIINAITGY